MTPATPIFPEKPVIFNAYQRRVYGHSSDYGYQHPANGYSYPYNDGEHYSPYTYNYSRGYQDR